MQNQPFEVFGGPPPLSSVTLPKPNLTLFPLSGNGLSKALTFVFMGQLSFVTHGVPHVMKCVTWLQ